MRQAFAGMLWSKQLYDYDVAPLAGRRPDPAAAARGAADRAATPAGATSRPSTSCRCRTSGSTRGSRRGTSAFHCVALAHVDPAFAKYQLVLLCREWFQHPNGALPAYEWDFGDVNPPVQAWAALEVFAIDGGTRPRLPQPGVRQAARQLHVVGEPRRTPTAPTCSRAASSASTTSARSTARTSRSAARLEQSDATGWMAFYALAMAAIASILNRSGQRPATDLVLKFLEHFAAIRQAMDDLGRVGRDRRPLLRQAGHARTARSCRSRCARWSASSRCSPPSVRRRARCSPGPRRSASSSPGSSTTGGSATVSSSREQGLLRGEPGERGCCSASSASTACAGCSSKLFDEAEFLSPYGLRALSAYHREHPYELDVEGVTATIDYEPAESTTAMFGGNSNWRGPAVVPAQLPRWSARSSATTASSATSFTVEYPTGSGQRLHARRDRRRPAPAARLAVPRRRRRPPAVLRRRRAPPERPGVEGQHRCSTSTSTATTAPGSAPRTRPAGPAWSPTSSEAVPATACTPWATCSASCTNGSTHPAHQRTDPQEKS